MLKIWWSAAYRKVSRDSGTTSKLSAKGRRFNFGRGFYFLAIFLSSPTFPSISKFFEIHSTYSRPSTEDLLTVGTSY